jgi:hypothetical protein
MRADRPPIRAGTHGIPWQLGARTRAEASVAVAGLVLSTIAAIFSLETPFAAGIWLLPGLARVGPMPLGYSAAR